MILDQIVSYIAYSWSNVFRHFALDIFIIYKICDLPLWKDELAA